MTVTSRSRRALRAGRSLAVLLSVAVLAPAAPSWAQAAPVAPLPVPAARPSLPAVLSEPLDMPVAPQAERAVSVPAGVPADPTSPAPSVPGPQPAVPLPPGAPELPPVPGPGQSLFTPFSKSTGKADGSVQAQVYPAPAFAREQSGGWRQTDADLVETADPLWPLQAPSTFMPMAFGTEPSRLVRVELPGGPVTFGAPEFARSKPAKKAKKGKGGSGAEAKDEPAERTVTYQAVGRDTELEYELSPAGFRESIALLSKKAPRTVRFHLSDPKGLLGRPVRTTAGGFVFDRDLGDGINMVLDAPAAFERPADPDAPPVVEAGSASMTVTPAGDGFDIVKSVDERWLKGKSFPIVLDPAIRFDSAATTTTDCWLRGGAQVNTRWCFNSLVTGNLGGDPSRSVVDFGTERAIPLGSRVDGATLALYQTGNTFGGVQTVTVSRETASLPFTNDATWNTLDGSRSWASVGSVAGGGPVAGADLGSFTNAVTSSATAGYRTVSDSRLTAQVQRWVNENASQPNTGLHLRTLESTSNGYIKFGSTKQSSSQWPYLTVSYTPPSPPQLTSFLATDRTCGTALPAGLPVVAGAVVNVCVRVTNTNSNGGGVRARVDGTVPAGLRRLALPTIDDPEPQLLAVDGRYCSPGFDDDRRCSTGVGDLGAFASIRLPLNGSYTLGYTAQVIGDDTGCRPITVDYEGYSVDYPSGPQDFSTSSLPLTACEGGLGSEAWWTLEGTHAGPQADLGVNVGNGNAVLQALDATPVQGHGRLSLFLRRTYNSQDAALSPLPGTIGAGWTLATGDAGDLAGAGVTPTGLTVPTLADAKAAVTSPLSVVLTDRDGTKHRFARRGEGLDVASLLAAPAGGLDTLRGVLSPRTLTAPAGRSAVLCVDTSYDSPPGVHLALWRYLAVGGGKSCGSASVTAADLTVVGYATARPDRLRSEFDLTGRLLNLTDATGNQLLYTYRTTGARGIGALARIAEVGPAGSPTASTEYRALAFDYPAGSTDTVIRDSGGRTIVYSFAGGDPSSVAATSPPPAGATPQVSQVRLSTVTTYRGTQPAGEVLARERYAYWGESSSNGLACPASSTPQPRGGLCAASDPRGSSETPQNATSQPVTIAYDSSTGPSARVARTTDRRGTVTAYTYGAATTTVDHNPTGDRGYDTTGTIASGPDVVHRTVYSEIDGLDRVGRVDRGSPGASATQLTVSSTTLNTWDSASNGCRLPGIVDGSRLDNNLCDRTEGLTAGAGGGYTTSMLYGAEGQLLSQTRFAGNARTVPLTTTWQWRTQYLSRGSSQTPCRDYLAPGGGASTLANSGPCTGGPDAGTLSAVTDQLSMLPARGNDTGPAGTAGADTEAFRTVWTVDNKLGQASNRPPNATSFGNGATVCGLAAAPVGNTGLRCAETAPQRSDTEAVTRYGYDSHGQRATMISPLALVRAGSGGDSPSQTGDRPDAGGAARYTYTYAGEGATDLSGTASAAGWLTAVTDPAGAFVAFAQDAAGNNARTWDRNATSGNAATFPTSTPGFTLVLHGPAGFTSPWRYATSSTSPLGNRTDVTFDDNGNPTALTDPRRNVTSSTFDGADQPVSVLRPAERAAGAAMRMDYDRYGNLVRSIDANGHVAATSWTTSNQPQAAAVVRGTAPTATGAGSDEQDCYPTSNPVAGVPGGLPAALPPGSLACVTVSSWDDGRQLTGVRDAHRATTYTYRDGAGRVYDTVVPRDATHFLHTVTVFDDEGRPLRTCRPRAFGLTTGAGARPAAACGSGQVQASHWAYNGAGMVTAETRFRDSTSVPLVTGHRYDVDGNEVAVTDPNASALPAAERYETARTFDLLQRVQSQTVPRSGPAGTSPAKGVTTSFGYDPVGNPTLTSWPDGQVQAKAYDLDLRATDTVMGYTGPTAPLTALRAGVRSATSAADGGSDTHTRVVYDASSNVVTSYGARAFTAVGGPDERYATKVGYDADDRPVSQQAARYDTADPVLSDAALLASSTQAAQCPTGQAGWPATVGVCTTRLGYDAVGNRSRLVLPTSGAADGSDGRRLDYVYTHDNLLTAVLSPSPESDTGAPVRSSAGFDGVGRTVLTVTPPTAASTGGRRTTIVFNADGTTAGMNEPGGAAGQARSTSMAYDADGNAIGRTDPLGQSSSTTFTSDALVSAQVDTGANTTRYGFDRNGNTLSVLSPSAVARDQTNPDGRASTYAWTRDNLLATLVKPAGEGSSYVTAYDYDDSGRTVGSDMVRRRSDGTDAAGAGRQDFTFYLNNRPRVHTGRHMPGQPGESITTCWTADGLPTVLADLRPGAGTILEGPRPPAPLRRAADFYTVICEEPFKPTSPDYWSRQSGVLQ